MRDASINTKHLTPHPHHPLLTSPQLQNTAARTNNNDTKPPAPPNYRPKLSNLAGPDKLTIAGRYRQVATPNKPRPPLCAVALQHPLCEEPRPYAAAVFGPEAGLAATLSSNHAVKATSLRYISAQAVPCSTARQHSSTTENSSGHGSCSGCQQTDAHINWYQYRKQPDGGDKQLRYSTAT